jgi:hypothetical protein
MTSVHLGDYPDFVRAPHALGGSPVPLQACCSEAEIPLAGLQGSSNRLITDLIFGLLFRDHENPYGAYDLRIEFD